MKHLKYLIVLLPFLYTPSLCAATPLRVALMDVEDLSGTPPRSVAAGTLNAGAIAHKGAPLVAKALVHSEAFRLIDRRDYLRHVEQMRAQGTPHTGNTLFLQAARALNAQAVLRSSILSFSSTQRTIDQGGHRVEFSTLTLRVLLEALDTLDGSILAAADGSAQREFRVTPQDTTVLGEEDVLQMFEQAVAKAAPNIAGALSKHFSGDKSSRVKLSLKTSADPALVEINGMLVGSTPLENFEVYPGDHLITIGKPGHTDISKRILIEKDTAITVPLLRNELTMEELTEVLKEWRLHRSRILEPAWIIQTLP